ncbi:MAG TPA: phosphoribosyltransferase family protein, partial [Polyangiaceae bacterium]|nr:phosphoribosyltransferase family protein [Polyangiaceae bacterium]
MSDPAKRERLLELLRERSFERKRVRLASGKESDFFIDCKQTVLTAEGHALSGNLLFDALAELPACDAVAGVELGGCPLASAVSLVSHQRGRDLPALYVRKQQKDHGSAKLVENDKALFPGIRVVLLEDVITTGGSSLRAVEALHT